MHWVSITRPPGSTRCPLAKCPQATTLAPKPPHLPPGSTSLSQHCRSWVCAFPQALQPHGECPPAPDCTSLPLSCPPFPPQSSGWMGGVYRCPGPCSGVVLCWWPPAHGQDPYKKADIRSFKAERLWPPSRGQPVPAFAEAVVPGAGSQAI